ncbi:MAG: hypothetical protein SGPRY_008351 [Prymnesium sp.]
MGSNRLRTCFIGNISYEASEEELRELFTQAGPITNLRLVVDRDSGKRKGFGFVEFTDQESALSAVRNLNETDFHGRPLRVNIAEQDTKNPQSSATSVLMQPASKKRKDAPAAGSPQENADTLPPLDHVDPLSKAIESYDRRRLFDALRSAKRLVHERADEADQLFTQQPALVRGLHFALDLLFGQHWPENDAKDEPSRAGAAPTEAEEVEDGSMGTNSSRVQNTLPCLSRRRIVDSHPMDYGLLQTALRLVHPFQRGQLLELKRQLREHLVAGNLAHLGISISLEDLPSAAGFMGNDAAQPHIKSEVG